MAHSLAAPLVFLSRHATRVLALSVLVGLALPDLAAFLRPALTPAVGLLLASALVRMDWAALLAYGRRVKLAAGFVAWLLLIAPLLMWAVCRALGLPGGLTAALVLMAMAPPITSAPAFALLLGLDAPLSVVAGLVATVVAPLTIPPLALQLLGLRLEIGLIEFTGRLVLLVGGAFAIAYLFRRIVGAERLERHARTVEGGSVVLMLIFAIAIMDGVTPTLLERPLHVLAFILAAFVANLGLQAVGALAFSRLGRREGLTVGLSSGNRNMGLLLAVLPAGTDYDILLYFALGQFPIYMLPFLTAPLYRKLLQAIPERNPPIKIS